MKLLVYCMSVLGCVVAHSFNMSIGDLSDDYVQKLFIESASRIPDISIPNTCQKQLLYMSRNWKNLNIFPMIDSFGKIPSGLMRGHIYSVGNFEECVNFNAKLPFPFGNLEGQYCRAKIPISLNSKEMEDSIDLMNKINGNIERSALQIHLRSGICVPKSCTAKDLQNILPFEVQLCKSKVSIPFEPLDYVTIVISSIIAVFLVVGTAYDYLYKGTNKVRFLTAFSVPCNAEKLFNISKGNKNSIECLNGIRVLSMIWVIYGHSFSTNLLISKINYIDYLKWSRTFFAMFTHNAYISVDTFFFLSGLLLSWIGMKEIEKRKGRPNVPMMYLHRYLRLTPMVAFIMLFAMSLLKFCGDGPYFDRYLNVAIEKCETNWWMNLLYIQNYAAHSVCIGQTWYLAVDFQLFLFSPLILYCFWKCGKKSFIGAAILIPISVGCIFGTFYKYDIAGALIINDRHSKERSDHYYFKTHMRYSIWLIGMCFGYILYRSKDKDVKITWYTQVLGWTATAGILYGVVMAPYATIHGYKLSTSVFSAASYESFSKIGWGLMLSWVVFACYHGYGGVINSFLSNPCWQPLARLSFAMYLCHGTLLLIINGNLQTSNHFSNFDSILMFWGHFGITVLVSIALVLALESPIIGIEKILLGGSSKAKSVIKEEVEVDKTSVEETKDTHQDVA